MKTVGYAGAVIRTYDGFRMDLRPVKMNLDLMCLEVSATDRDGYNFTKEQALELCNFAGDPFHFKKHYNGFLKAGLDMIREGKAEGFKRALLFLEPDSGDAEDFQQCLKNGIEERGFGQPKIS